MMGGDVTVTSEPGKGSVFWEAKAERSRLRAAILAVRDLCDST
jgi:hypothetical protein